MAGRNRPLFTPFGLKSVNVAQRVQSRPGAGPFRPHLAGGAPSRQSRETLVRRVEQVPVKDGTSAHRRCPLGPRVVGAQRPTSAGLACP